MIYNGIVFLGYKEEWKIIDFKDIMKDTYEVSNLGRFRVIKSGRILHGCNPNNERGHYMRVALKSKNGKVKKYPMHRVVLKMFGEYDDTLEVNHINHKKYDNSVYNLENMTRKENAEDAAIYNLYQFGEKHYKSIFTDNEVHEICRLLERGTPVNKIIKKMHLEKRGSIMSNIDKIATGKAWVRISKQYDIDYKKYHYKTYSYEDLMLICRYMFEDGLKNSQIMKLFPKYKNKAAFNVMLKSLKKGRVYKKLLEEYKSSTTIESIT